MHKIYWCEVGLQLAEIGTKNVGEPDLTPRTKYIVVRLYKCSVSVVKYYHHIFHPWC